MEKLLRYWEQNKRKILITIAVIALVIILMQMINAIIKQQNAANSDKETQNTLNIAQDITKPNQAVISDTKLNEEQTEDNAKIIEDFVNYCNQKNIDAAYNLLSDSCKEEIYNIQEIFTTGYVNQIFSQEVNYSLELWYTNGNYATYQITYNQGNLLQTGRTSI